MTTPVEADIEPGKMRFFVGEKDLLKPRPNTNTVTVRDLKPMTVVVLLASGEVTVQENFKENKSALLNWLGNNPNYEQAGPALCSVLGWSFYSLVFKTLGNTSAYPPNQKTIEFKLIIQLTL